MRILMLPLALVFTPAAIAAPTGHLNDTGQSLCYDSTGAMALCTTANSGDNAVANRRQDGRFGRDAKAAAGSLTKTGAGSGGFDFTKIANNGTTLATGAALGAGGTDWACTRDNHTGLIWEVKTTSGFRSKDWKYTWYNTDPATNGGHVGSDGVTMDATICGEAGYCNTSAYTLRVNTATLCGANDWRMPTRHELQSILNDGRSSPAIDPDYFVNTAAETHWTATPYAQGSSFVWTVFFNDGLIRASNRTMGLDNIQKIRLVRSVPN